MTTQQIYTILNETASQSMGATAVNVIDTASFIALGNAILNSGNNVEPFLNTLVQRIGRTVLVNRAYRSQFRNLIKGEMEFGAILQKVSVDMPEVVEDASLVLTDGQSVDQYIVNKPKVNQWLFIKDSTYSIFVTIQERWLRQAFLNESAMAGFISLVFQRVQNKLEICIENLCRAAMNNYAASVGANQTLNMVTMYNTEAGLTATDAIPAGMSAMFNDSFLRWCAGTIRELGRNMTNMSRIYNREGEERHSPVDRQNLALLSKFHTQLETVSYASAFNVDYLKLVENYTVPFWQGSGTDILDYESQSKIMVTIPQATGANKEVTLTNVIGMMFDDDALGAFRKWQSTRTTPMNARGLYANTFWHEDQMWFNAFDENFVLLTLN